jgi:DNA-binding HxlR family transcriptional regulator
MTDENWELQRLRILGVVAEGLGQYDTRRIDLIHSYRGGRAEHTVMQELELLQERGLVERHLDERAVFGSRWAITADGEHVLAEAAKQ